MSESPRTRRKGTGALPMVETRTKYAQLMSQGISNAEACRTLHINRRTGSRWRHCRTATDARGRTTTYAPVSLKAPPTISSRYLSEGERIQIADALQVGKSLRQIAAELGRSPSTVSREVVRNRSACLKRYAPRAAQALANAARKRPRPGKIAGNQLLRDAISKHVLEQWSPRQISHQLRVDYPGQPEMNVVHESIYQALYSPRATGPSRGMTRHLRTGRRGRLNHRRTSKRRSRFSGPLLDERPAEVDKRLVPRHWEGDLVCGTVNRSAIATLVERTTGLLLLVRLPASSWTIAATYVRERTTEWAVNANGETYGALNDCGEPDLIAVIATNRNEGFVHAEELAQADSSEQAATFTSPEQALTWQESMVGKTVSVPVYENDGETRIGDFTIQY